MGKKKLLLSIEDLKALGVIKKRKKHKKRKKVKVYENNIYGIKSESNHMVGFGSQLSPQNDLQNELLRQQIKTLQNDQNIRNDQHQLMIEDNRFNRNEYYPRITQLEQKHSSLINQSQKIVRDIYSKFKSDNVDVSRTGGSDFFNMEGKPIPENDNVNQNFADYTEQNLKILFRSPEKLEEFRKKKENMKLNNVYDPVEWVDDNPDPIDEIPKTKRGRKPGGKNRSKEAIQAEKNAKLVKKGLTK